MNQDLFNLKHEIKKKIFKTYNSPAWAATFRNKIFKIWFVFLGIHFLKYLIC